MLVVLRHARSSWEGTVGMLLERERLSGKRRAALERWSQCDPVALSEEEQRQLGAALGVEDADEGDLRALLDCLERPLQQSGVEDARLVGSRLPKAHRVFCSPGMRAQMTGRAACEDFDNLVELKRVLWEEPPPPKKLLKMARRYLDLNPGKVLWIIGHNPCLSRLGRKLGCERDELPTAGALVVKYNPEAKKPQRWRILSYLSPKTLRNETVCKMGVEK